MQTVHKDFIMIIGEKYVKDVILNAQVALEQQKHNVQDVLKDHFCMEVLAKALALKDIMLIIIRINVLNAIMNVKHVMEPQIIIA